ncbi:MAG TPA: glycine cleavage T C-terminal barrel domain-containing protein [Terriglobales bacterium]|nr:glycine cleavage T C-terminal barrel domain-containing protein [Terriglobales bacterium]
MTSAFHDVASVPASGVYGSVAFPGNVAGEFHILLKACGVYDLSLRAKAALTGSDRVRWLNGMITNNVRDLALNQGVYGFLLNPQGRILGDLYAYNRGESLIIDTDQGQLPTVLALFDRYIIMDDVEVANLDGKLTAIGVAGPGSRDILRSAGLELTDLAPLQVADMLWNDIKLTIVRNDNPAIESYELWLAPEHISSLQEALIRAGAKSVGSEALDLMRIAAGMPRYGKDIRERDLPQETEQKRALHFTKGCYVGQEIVERIRSRGNVHRKFTGFEVDGQLPLPGTKIEANGKDIGEITSSATLPVATGGRSVALGYIRREAEKPGNELSAGDARLTVANLPFANIF